MAELASLVQFPFEADHAREFYDIVDRYSLDEEIPYGFWKATWAWLDSGIESHGAYRKSEVKVVSESLGFVVLDRCATKGLAWADVRVKLGPGRYEVEPR